MSKPLNQVISYAQRRGLPLIPIHAKNVSIINGPDLFYRCILDKIKLTKHSLALSALYLGNGDKEYALIQAICDNLQRNSNLNVNVVLDANRATRLDGKGRSSVTTLKKASTFNNVGINLFQTGRNNTIISKLLHKIQKWNEILSTYHSKMLVFDNDVLITGANLSNIYFERRLDRYMMIENSKILSDYMFKLLEKFHRKQSSLKDVLRDHNDIYTKKLAKGYDIADSDSYIMPLIQYGSHGLTDKEDFLLFLDSISPADARIHMSTGYFNPSSIISTLKISSVLAPSERANGFYNGGGLLKYVPRIYSALHKQYIVNHHRCKLFLYDKPDWSFHAKGLWVEGLNDLYVHLIGSSNFNCRSSSRDFETQFALLTKNKDLANELTNERIALWKESIQVEAHSIRGLNPIYNTSARILKTFL